jgi:hypothetical protein
MQLFVVFKFVFADELVELSTQAFSESRLMYEGINTSYPLPLK